MTKIAFALALLIAGCAGVQKEVKEYTDGAVVCLKEYQPRAEALGKSLAIHAVSAFLSGQSTTDVFDGVESEAEAAVAAVGLPVAACAFSDLVDEISRLFHKAGWITPMVAGTVSDQLEGGRRALASFLAAHGITSVQREQ